MNSATILRSPGLAEGGDVRVIRLYAKPEPLAFRRGGLARAAEQTRRGGRGDDDVLLHISAEEFEALKAQWGEPEINPNTGLPEYGFLSKLWKKVKKAVKKFAPVLSFVLPFIPGVGPALGALGKTLLGKVGMSAATAAKWGPAVGNAIKGGAFGAVSGGGKGALKGALLGGLTGGGARNIGEKLGLVAPTPIAAPEVPYNEGLAPGEIGPPSPGMGPPTPTNLPPAPAPPGGGGMLGKIGAYVKEHPYKSAAIGALGLSLLGGKSNGSGNPLAPQLPSEFTKHLPTLDFNRAQQATPQDWYTYGQRPEQSFYSENEIPEYDPNAPEPIPGAAKGGALKRYVSGPGTGRSDSIPARLSDGEYVLTAEDVALIGDGSSNAGARRLDQWRQELRKHKGRALARGKISPNAKKPSAYLRGAR
jgi:hypothetical protein